MKGKLTASTITDEQIRTLRAEAMTFGLEDVESWCDVALGEVLGDATFHTQRSASEALRVQLDARGRCVDCACSSTPEAAVSISSTPVQDTRCTR